MSVLTFRDIHCHSIRLSPTNWTKGKKKKKKSWNQGRTPSASQLPRVKFLTFNFQLSWLKVFTISSKETSPVDMLYCAQSRPTLWDPIDYSPLGSSVHGISQAEILEWVAISSSRGSPQPRDRTHISCVSCIAERFFTSWAIREAQPSWYTIVSAAMDFSQYTQQFNLYSLQ